MKKKGSRTRRLRCNSGRKVAAIVAAKMEMLGGSSAGSRMKGIGVNNNPKRTLGYNTKWAKAQRS